MRRDDGRLGVERIEDRLDEDDLGPAVDEPPHLLGVSVAHLVEGHGAVARIVHVRRDRERAVRRADGAGHEAAAAVFLLGEKRRLAGKARALEVQVVDDLLHAVIGLGDGGAGEGVGLDDVGAGAEIVEVHVAHRVGLGEDQQVVVAFDVLLPVLEALAAKILFREARALQLRAHRAVEHENALGGGFAERLEHVGAIGGARSMDSHSICSLFIAVESLRPPMHS